MATTEFEEIDVRRGDEILTLRAPKGTPDDVIRRRLAQMEGGPSPSGPPGQSAAQSVFARGILLFGSGFNTGLANVLGFPADVVAAAARALGLPTADVPLGGSAMIKRGLRAVGLPLEGDVPGGGFVKRVGEEIGASVVPAGAASTAARAGLGVTRQIVGPLLRPFVQQPGRAVATEAAIAASGGVGAATAREVVPESPVAELTGLLAGSVATGGLLATGERAVGLARRVTAPFRESGIERQAAARLQGSVARPREQVLTELERGTTAVREALDVTPTTAQATGDPGLLSAERSLARRSPAAKGEFEDIVRSQRQAVRRAAEEVIPEGRPEAVREMLEAQRQKAQAVADAAIGKADARVREALASTTDPLEANRVIRQSLAEAEGAAQQKAHELFQRVGDVRGPVERLRGIARAIRREARQVERPEDMPEAIGVALRLGRRRQGKPTELVGPTGTPLPTVARPTAMVPVDELMALRSRISQDIREELAQAAPNRLRVSRLERLKDGVDDTITQDFGDAGPVYEEARQFFRREVADRFRRGTVAEVLRSGPLGEPGRLPQSGIIARFFRSGRGATEAAQDFNRVLGNEATAREALRDGVVQQFADFAVRPDGRFDSIRARQWTARFKDALAEFPDIRAEVRRVTQLGDDAAQVRLSVEKSLQRFQDSSLRFFLDADPDHAVKGVLGSKDPTAGLRSLVRAVRENPEALQGLRGAVWAQALGRAETGTFDEAIGAAFLSPVRMRKFLETNRRAFVASGLYTTQQIERVEQIVRGAEIVNRSMSVGLTGGSDTAANLQGLKALTGLTMPGLWSRFYSIARGVVSPRFVASEISSRVGRSILNKITDDKVTALVAQALKDPDVARSLLLRETTVSPLLVAQRLHGHLVNLGPVALGDERAERTAR